MASKVLAKPYHLDRGLNHCIPSNKDYSGLLAHLVRRSRLTQKWTREDHDGAGAGARGLITSWEANSGEHRYPSAQRYRIKLGDTVYHLRRNIMGEYQIPSNWYPGLTCC